MLKDQESNVLGQMLLSEAFLLCSMTKRHALHFTDYISLQSGCILYCEELPEKKIEMTVWLLHQLLVACVRV